MGLYEIIQTCRHMKINHSSKKSLALFR
uniref:Uncharacterized protein n=1 Tax=Rhizophora mucronata TaxID=61149 RepID=A0A2P2PH14_RHIMU